jgi:WD40 repeat protein/DNA-binding SARP family transcriptional activator
MTETQLPPSNPLGSGVEGSSLEPTVNLRVLGPLEVVSNGVDIRLGGPKQRTVLAVLVAEVGKPVSVDTLIDAVWGEEPTAGARSTLQTYVSNLRAAIGDIIVREDGGYRLATEPKHVDAVEFEDAVTRAAELVESDPAEASQRLRAGLALWRGHPYADVTAAFRLELEARRLEELRLRAVETRIDAELALGHHAELIPELEVLCEEFPVQERFRAQHMLALYRSGRQAEALRAYQKTRTYLADELGLEPSPQVQGLERQILNQDPSLLLDEGPQIQTLAFLLTDIEDSTMLWELHTKAMRAAVAEHDRIVMGAVEAAGGRVVKRVGDGVDFAFGDVGGAVTAASESQRLLAEVDWGEPGPLLVRMVVDVGEVEARGGDYFGPVLNRAGRLLAAGHGGQVLLSADAHAALSSTRAGWQAKALGDFRFKGIGSAQNVFQLLLAGLPTDYPPLRIDRLPPAVAPGAFGRSVRGYELREQIGVGDFGIVYRAYQPSVGREVAMKVIRSDLANRASFVRDFESEARLVAQLEHPHIVALYDYWRDPDGAYLVMRWLRGGSLRQALERGPWNLEPASRLLAQVGGALAYAHRQGVVHGDVKPANVLLDEEGHAYLSDFGIAARLADPERPGSPVGSSPAYVSPEELAGQPHTPRSDLYALGVVTFELLTGKRPPMDAALPSLGVVRPELPSALGDVIARATATDPDERYESVDAFLRSFASASGAATAAADEIYTPAESPYKGLKAFGEVDADDFFGRESLVDELVAAVGDHRLVAVVGPSGIGKSSVVKAGLIPALRRGVLSGSDQWVISDMFPGSYPFEELASGLLRVAVERPDGLVEELARDELGMRRVAKRILPPDSTLLLVIDQFEELFTLTAKEETRRLFLDGLTSLAADARAPVRVVVTLRADFLDHPLRYPEFGELLRSGIVPVAVPSEDELGLAIERPAERVGVRFEPGLVSRIIGDVHAQPGALPLLQYALTELFAARTSDVLTVDGYSTTGGVVGALGRRAEELYAQLDPTTQAACRQVFLRLVSVDPGAQDTRRRVRRRELRRLGLEPDAIEAILTRYGEHRLLSFDREPLTRTPTVEVAHEAILSQWDRLRAWIEERREDLLLHRRLVEAVDQWEEAKRDPEYLPGAGRLTQFETWAAATDLALTTAEREFLAEARAAAEDTARRRSRRRRTILAGFASLAAAASLLAVLAFVQRGRAERDARAATSRELAAAAVANLDIDPERSTLLALEAVDATRQADGMVLREAEEALHRAVQRSRIVRVFPHGGSLAVSAGARFVTGTSDPGDNAATVWNTETGEKLREIREGRGERRVGLSPAGDRVATTNGESGNVRLWDAVTGEQLRVLRGPRGLVWYPTFSPDGKLVAAGGENATAVRVWDVATGALRTVLTGHDVYTIRVAFSPDGSRLATANHDGAARIWSLATGDTAVTLHGHEFSVRDVAFSPDGAIVATAGADGTVRLWDATSGRHLRTFHVATSAYAIDYSPDGTRIATAGGDGVARVFEAGTGRELLALAGHTGAVLDVAFTPNGDRVLTGGIDGTTRLWNVSADGGRDWVTVPAAKNSFTDVAFSPDGARFAAPAEPSGVTVWDTETGDEVITLTGHEPKLSGVAFSPDGTKLAAVSGTTSTPPVWDVETGKLLFTLRGLRAARAVAFSPDGALLVSSGYDGTARLWDAATGKRLGVLRPDGVVSEAAFSPDGRFIVTGEYEGGVTVWDTGTLKQVRAFDAHPNSAIGGLAFGPDGMFVTSGGDGTAKVWDFDSGEERATLRGHTAGLQHVAVAPDGSRVATASDDGTAKLWDPETGELLLTLFGHDTSVYGIDFHPDGRLLATASPDGTAALHLLPVDEFVTLARERVTRSLTAEECREYLHVEACPVASPDNRAHPLSR